jgi:molybdopterin-guanine dinucleotide biosynthesis protein A
MNANPSCSAGVPSAAILAGGGSRRFGSDKTLASFQGKALVSHVKEGVEPYVREVFIVSKDIEKYAFLGIRRTADIYDAQCQLTGIITALETVSCDSVFIIAADMPFFPFAALPDMARLSEGFDAVVPVIDSRPCPCAAIYKKSAKKIFMEFFMAGDYRIIHSLAKLKVRYLDERFFSNCCDPRRAFANINTREDLAALQE